MMRRIAAAGLGGLALLMVVCCSSKDKDKEDGGTGATTTTGTGGSGVIFADGSTGGTAGGGTVLQPCDISKTLPGCTASSTSATLRTVNMLLVLDKSGSMNQTGLGATGTKWDAVKTALNTALHGSRTLINFGLDLFPRQDVPLLCSGDQCCQTPALTDPLTVPVGPGAETVPLITQALAATSPGGGTPAAAALSRALDYYATGDGSTLPGDKYVLFVTDGGPNCNVAAVPSCDGTTCTRNLDPDPNCSSANCCSTSALAVNCLDDGSVTTAIANLKLANVTTIVVGIPGSENYVSYLNAFANAGGKPQANAATSYYAVAASAGAEGLATTLHDITIDLVKSCVITYQTPPQDPDQVTVLVNCNPVSRDPATDGGDGSYWTLDQAAKTITLGGPICDQILNQGVNRVDYVFGCNLIVR